jgi:hypothetical protein
MSARHAVELQAEAEYLSAFTTIMKRIEGAVGPRAEPVVLCVCGGAALHLYTGARVSKDVDATILAKFLPPSNLNVAYRGTDGHARLLYYDTQFNGGFSLLHEKAYRDSLPVKLAGIDAKRLDVRLLSPIDLAVSRLARFDSQDEQDIRALAQSRLIDATALRQRAEEALPAFPGEAARVRESLTAAVSLIEKAVLH